MQSSHLQYQLDGLQQIPAINSNSNDALLIKEERPYEEHASQMAYINSEAIIMMDETATAESKNNDSQIS